MDSKRLSLYFLNAAKFCIFLSLLTPLIVWRDLYFPFMAGKIIFFRFTVQIALFCLLAAFFLAPEREEFRLRTEFKNPLTIAVVLFSLIFFFSCLWGVNPRMSLFSNFERGDGGIQMLHHLAFFLLLVILFRSPQDWRRLFVFSLAVTLLVCAYGLGQYREATCAAAVGVDVSSTNVCQTGYFLGARLRIPATLGNPLFLAVYLSFQLFFVCALMITVQKKSLRILLGFVGVVFFASLYLTRVRAVMAGMIAAWLFVIPGACFLSRDTPAGGKLRRLYYIFTGLVLFSAVLLVLSFPDAAARYLEIARPATLYNALKDRLWAWGVALSALLARPFGWGAENFPLALDRFYDPRLFGVESWFDRVHNIYLDYAVSGGFPLLTAFLGIFVLFFIQASQSLRNMNDNRPRFYLITLSCYFIFVYLVQGFSSFDVVTTVQLLFLSFAYFLFLVRDNEKRKLPDRPGAPVKPEDAARGCRTPIGKPAPLPGAKKGSALGLSGRIGRGMVMAAAFTILGGSLYWLDYLPLKRNLAIASAAGNGAGALHYMAQTGRFDFPSLFGMIRLHFLPALRSSSPIGGGEAVLIMSHLVNKIIVCCGINQIQIPEAALRPVIAEINREFAVKGASGELNGARYYLDVGNMNLNAAKMTGEGVYLEKAAGLFAAGLQSAPARLEILLAKLDLAMISKNSEEEYMMLSRIRAVLPDFRLTKGDVVAFEQRYCDGLFLQRPVP